MSLEGWCDPVCESINFETVKSHPYLTVFPPGGSSCGASSAFTREFNVNVTPDAPPGVHYFELAGTMTDGTICSAMGKITVISAATLTRNPQRIAARTPWTGLPDTATSSTITVTWNPPECEGTLDIIELSGLEGYEPPSEGILTRVNAETWRYEARYNRKLWMTE